jgi:Tfp pilus assembly protein PilX
MRHDTTSTIRRQQGVVLFIALIVMVAMSLAAIALIRSVDTTNVLIGNLAFRQSSILPANLAVEQAAAALFTDAAPVAPTIDPTTDLAAENYYSTWQGNDDARGIPKPLQTKGDWATFGLAKELVDTGSGINIRYVIERMCLAGANGIAATPQYCDMLPPKVATGTTIHDCDQLNTTPGAQPGCFALDPIPFYRVTVRVDGPQNSTSFLQAMLR